MPTTTEKNYVLGVKISGGASGQVWIAFRNGSTEDITRVLTVSSEAKVNLSNKKDFPNGFSNEDAIEIKATGAKTGGTTHIVDRNKGGAGINLTLVDTSTTNTPAIRI